MTVKQEAEKLLNAVLPLAKKMLVQHGEFHPYGGYLKFDGTIVDVGPDDPDTEYPKARDLIYVLQSSFREMAQAKKCKAAAIVLNVAVDLPASTQKSDAIAVRIDHIAGYSAEVFFPYAIVNDSLVYGEVFAEEGNHEIFGPAGDPHASR